MEQYFNDAREIVVFFMKLFLIALFGIMILNYVSLTIVVEKTINQAEKDGYIDYDVFLDNVQNSSINMSDVVVEKVEPDFGEYVNKLGDSLKLHVSGSYEVRLFGKKKIFKYSIKKIGINQGYYGAGY
ncbi:hypothetical protein [Maledivibacter halophilus]|uniref:DUF4320 family protein n=1 Tax=Maledivibacter halophilus TaxID=36842 RepID=A0A1T5MFH8_9FIRM|nr:hypothetical protein [Maledivibacter halophilus]SKC86823.1 hypothetical protein SAMN02194393_04577 [Maledivibacter halophilus]